MIGPDHSAMIHDRIIQPDFAPCKILTKRQMNRRQTIMDDQELDWDESNCSCFGFCGCFFSCLQDRKAKIATRMLFGAVSFFFFSKHKMQEFPQEKKTKKCKPTREKHPFRAPPHTGTAGVETRNDQKLDTGTHFLFSADFLVKTNGACHAARICADTEW